MLRREKYNFMTGAIASFVMAFILYSIIFTICGFAPFGRKTVLTWDLDGQYIAYLSYFRRTILEKDFSFYTQEIVLGGGTIGLWAYYLLSPFNLILLYFDTVDLPIGISVILLLKHAVSALTMYLYCFFRYQRKSDIIKKMLIDKKQMMGVAFSCIYALSGYAINMQFNLMWLDGMILLPLLCVGLEYLVYEGKTGVVIASLWLSVITNFYIGYMLWVFSALYFIFLLIESEKMKEWKIWRRYIGCAILAAGMGMVLILPLVYSLSISKMSGSSIVEKIIEKLSGKSAVLFLMAAMICCVFIIALFWRKNIKELFNKVIMFWRDKEQKKPVFSLTLKLVLMIIVAGCCWKGINWGSNKGILQKESLYWPLKLIIGAFSPQEIRNGLPNLFVSSLVVILAVRMLISKSVSIKTKWGYLGLLGILLVSMLIKAADLMWHGFSAPHGSPWRYSFLISFVLILMAMQCFKEEAEEDIECRKLKKHWKFYGLLLGWLFLCFYKYPSLNSEFLSTKKIVITIVVYCSMIFLLNIKKLKVKYVAVAILLCFELICNAVLSLEAMDYTELSEYQETACVVDQIVSSLTAADQNVYRIDTPDLGANSALLYGYDSLGHYSSMIPARAVLLLNEFGMKPDHMGEMETLYQADVSASDAGVLNVKYVFSKENLQKRGFTYLYDRNGYSVYENPEWKSRVFWLQENTVTDCVEDFKSVTDCIVQTDIQIKENLSNKIVLTVNQPVSDANRKLLFSIVWDKGWKAYLDGKETEIGLAYQSLMYLDVPSGEHEVVLEYEAPYLKIGMEISGIFVGIALCMVLISVMKNTVYREKSREKQNI